MVYYFLFLLLLPHCCKGVPQLIGSSQPILANIGDDVILPCHLKPSIDAATHTVEWTRPDLKPRFVHLWRSGEEILDDQNPWYVGRTSLFISELKNGNVSLKLSRVKLSDRGTYRCFIPTINRDTTVELLFGTPQLIGSSQPILANIGDDVILPCHLKPPVDAATHTVEWTRPDLEPRFIHVWRSSEELLNNQNPWYVGRTSLFISELKNGNVSLKLSRVKLSDRGTYRCFIPTINRDTTVELLFGSVSSPSINISKSSSGLSLDCRSEGWFPQPEVRWLDAEGTVLSAGPTETLTGPDGLFTVSSRLNMEKTNRDSVTCRVHQEQINQTRETHLQVSADFFESSSSSSSSSSCVVYVSITVVTVLSVSVAAAFIFWKWRKIQSKG
ncbi:butyrophilin subfamily 3 member A2-like [Halichoeres trimaculatus]|uniref:butyrophilin subfamily 3 member A2-like n=1 Tax=Halichoeres trimaculatus TaxID=147232 RepID=UPI003D9F63BC